MRSPVSESVDARDWNGMCCADHQLPPPPPVGSFDVRAGMHSPIKMGGLAAPYAGTSAFAVSLEHGQAIPAAPSDKVALGQVS